MAYLDIIEGDEEGCAKGEKGREELVERRTRGGWASAMGDAYFKMVVNSAAEFLKSGFR